MRRRFVRLAVTGALLVAACGGRVSGGASAEPAPGDAGDSSAEAPLTELYAQVPSPPATTSGLSLRVAIVWELNSFQPVASDQFITEDLGVVLPQTFPFHFVVDRSHPPPAAAMSTWTNEQYVFQGSAGRVVIYEDSNDNQQYDLAPADATAPIDRLVGVNVFTGIEYYAGAPEVFQDAPYLTSWGMQPGYNLVARGAYGIGPECMATPCVTGIGGVLFSPTTEVVVPPTDGAGSPVYQCATWTGVDSTAGSIGTPCPGGVPPAGSGVICATNAYLAVTLDEPLPLCDMRGRVHYCAIAEPTPAPSGWPCP